MHQRPSTPFPVPIFLTRKLHSSDPTLTLAQKYRGEAIPANFNRQLRDPVLQMYIDCAQLCSYAVARFLPGRDVDCNAVLLSYAWEGEEAEEGGEDAVDEETNLSFEGRRSRREGQGAFAVGAGRDVGVGKDVGQVGGAAALLAGAAGLLGAEFKGLVGRFRPGVAGP